MTEKTQHHDFIELDYTGKLADGTVFDTTLKSIANEHKLSASNREFKPTIICIGEQQLLPGLDAELQDKEIGKEYTVTLPPEKAFGKRDIKKVKIIPLGTFREHKMEPHPGLQIDVDGEMGTVTNISGGRVIVNFNHPLSGKEVTYTFKILRQVTDVAERITAFLITALRLPEDKLKVGVKDNEATIELPVNLPPQITDIFVKKLGELTGLKTITFLVAGQQ